MIQRIQSIYLILAAVCMGSSVFFPLATATGDASALAGLGDNFFADGVFWEKEFPGWFGVLIVAGVSIAAVFLYKNRPRQMQLTSGMTIVSFFIVVMFAALGYYYAQALPEGAAVHLALGSAFPVLAIPCLWLAYRAIRKDEDLVRSSDRLR